MKKKFYLPNQKFGNFKFKCRLFSDFSPKGLFYVTYLLLQDNTLTAHFAGDGTVVSSTGCVIAALAASRQGANA